MSEPLRVVLLGTGATLAMDIWTIALRRLANIPSLDYRLVGRWIGCFHKGRLVHHPIFATQPVTGEKWLGWAAHYAIGIAFAWLFTLLVGPAWLDRPSPAAPIFFGAASVLVPYFVMQPALGLGVAASRTPNPRSARLKSLATHLVFGAGLYLSALLLARVVDGPIA